ncbi:MAG TPA: hypothetical protein PKX27_10380 [Bacteroidales bacterium]|jgi:hypothetical protein|nr:hypothetical protein [Bacteroidales bacterium]
MKKQLRLLSIAFAGVVTMIACERKDQFQDHNLRPDFTERSFANNGMIKSYDNSVVLKWNEAVSLAVDNKMPLWQKSPNQTVWLSYPGYFIK